VHFYFSATTLVDENSRDARSLRMTRSEPGGASVAAIASIRAAEPTAPFRHHSSIPLAARKPQFLDWVVHRMPPLQNYGISDLEFQCVMFFVLPLRTS
jgi:hypothetical protein